jgi:hypothetical protein
MKLGKNAVQMSWSALGEHVSGKEQSEERNGWTNRHFTHPGGESIHGHNFCLLCAP